MSHTITVREGSPDALDGNERPIRAARAAVKRAEDVVLACLALLLLWPVLVAVAIKLDTRGPVFFKQPRRGLDDRVFAMYKFRSMHARMSDVACVRQTGRRDRRVTRVGAFLRRHSLDELPQLLNVLRGEMSLVGPRPHALATRVEGLRLDEVVQDYVARLRVRPGVTGWAQVNGWRGALASREALQRRVAFDLDDIERWSLRMDLRILWRTLWCVIRDPQAYEPSPTGRGWRREAGDKTLIETVPGHDAMWRGVFRGRSPRDGVHRQRRPRWALQAALHLPSATHWPTIQNPTRCDAGWVVCDG